ncbi:MAG: hypothetical protein ACOVQ7_19800 [Limnoraphis robusta]
MVSQIQSTIKTEIISTYVSDFDGLTVDTIQMTYPDGTTEIRYGWMEEDFYTGETTYYIRTKSGAVLNSNWKTTRNNKWLVSYKSVKLSAKQTEIINHNSALEVLASPELFDRAEYEQAKADLGF